MNNQDLEKLARKFPLSEATRRRNQVGSVSSRPKPEQTLRHESLGKNRRKKEDPKRYRISIVSFRVRLIDPDNLCAKFFIDSLRYSRVIDDDSSRHVIVEVSQQKVAKTNQQRTEITITPI